MIEITIKVIADDIVSDIKMVLERIKYHHYLEYEIKTIEETDDIEKYNIKWLKYMRGQNIHDVTRCPNGHRLVAYTSKLTVNQTIITCNKSSCEYFDYSTFAVPSGINLSMRLSDE